MFIFLNSLYIGVGYLLFRLSVLYLSNGSDHFLCGWVDPYPCNFAGFLKEGAAPQILYGQAFAVFLSAWFLMTAIASLYKHMSPYFSKQLKEKILKYKDMLAMLKFKK